MTAQAIGPATNRPGVTQSHYEPIGGYPQTGGAERGQGFITCIPNADFPASVIYYWLHESMEKILNHASGATFKEIGKRAFKEFDIAVPPGAVIGAFVTAVEPMWREIRNLLLRNLALRQTRDLLLPKLISGEVDVEGWPEAMEQTGVDSCQRRV